MYDEDYENFLRECDDPDHEHDYSCASPITIKVTEKKFETKDSGNKAKYIDGMQRDTSEGKPQFSLMFPKGVPFEEQLMTRVADLYHRGGVKYGPRNWEKSSTEESLAHHEDALMRHVIRFLLGVDDGEDHAAAVVWNVNAVDLTRRKIKKAAALEASYSANTLPDNEVTRRIDAFLEDPSTGVRKSGPPKDFPTVEFADGDQLLDRDRRWWEWSEIDNAWYCKAEVLGIPEVGYLAGRYGPLMFQTGAYAGITMLKDGSLRWG